MSYPRTRRAGVLVLALLLTLGVFAPVGVYLQWSMPQDFPPIVCACISASIGGLILLLALIKWHRRRTVPRMQWPRRVGAVCLFVLSALVLIVTCFPPISRRVGPWAELRGVLVEKSMEVVEARAALSIPASRDLTSGEMDQIERMVFEPVPTYTFPVINKTVNVRLMSRVPPYVGVDFGGGRRAVFDLSTMMVIYTD
jgi:hypothetical protein